MLIGEFFKMKSWRIMVVFIMKKQVYMGMIVKGVLGFCQQQDVEEG